MSTAATETLELVRSAAAGDDEAFRRLVRQVYPTLRRWALARTGDPDDADEVVQRALIRMHRSLGTFGGEARLTSWLYRIVTNAAIDLHRSRTARPGRPGRPAEIPDVDPERSIRTDPIRAMHAGRMAAAVRDFFEILPPRQREVLELVDHQGMRPVDVAEALGVKPVSVRANLFKARRTVRRAILERYPELREGYES